jgi:hypothetical protein
MQLEIPKMPHDTPAQRKAIYQFCLENVNKTANVLDAHRYICAKLAYTCKDGTTWNDVFNKFPEFKQAFNKYRLSPDEDTLRHTDRPLALRYAIELCDKAMEGEKP